MRRFIAIALITAMICSTGLPVWASTCEAMRQTPMCHRMQDHQSAKVVHKQHHCEMMADEDDTTLSQSTGFIKGHASQCPMQCCMQAKTGGSSAIPAIALITVLLSSENHIFIPAVTFSTPGFSSHTDRGPPAA